MTSSTSVKGLIPHLHFSGEAAQAIAHYERALGAHTAALMRWRDLPDGGVEGDEAERVMHARLLVGPATLLVADRVTGSPSVPSNGTILLELDDADEMARRFEALATGGRVTMPIHDAFWGAKFGILEDPFGVTWMFHLGSMND